MATLYDMLGVHENATDAEIKRAYRRAAMQAHPDRNVGNEASAHARFQEIKEAYSILSDPEQRQVYDAVYAEEMNKLARDLAVEEERLRAEREAEYARFVALAMRFAEQGHNRDVVFGVLLGRECEPSEAGKIADSVVALWRARRESEAASTVRASADERDAETVEAAVGSSDDDAALDESGHARLFSSLWQGLFGVRS